MSLSTHSKFYYGHLVTSDNYQLNFDEGSGELTAELRFGSYTATEFASEIKRAMDAAGDETYTVTFDRDTRLITISGTAPFDLLTQTGTQFGTSPWDLMGFDTSADHTGLSSYDGETESGEMYQTQFILQSYVGPEDLQRSVDSTIHESASGEVQVFSFGVVKFIEMNFRFVTNQDVGDSGWIRNDPAGVEKLQAFMQFLVKKARLEFMPDEDDTATFIKVMLESTPEDQNGVGYRLNELYGQGLPNFFETGTLRFRVLE